MIEIKFLNANVYIDIKDLLKISLLKLYKSEMRAWPHPRSMQGVKKFGKNEDHR